MKKTTKFASMFLAIIIFCLSFVTTAFAENEDKNEYAYASDNVCYIIEFETPNTFEGITRGDDPPYYSHSLPYTAYATNIYNYVYTNYCFKAPASGFRTIFSGEVSSGTSRVTIELYKKPNNYRTSFTFPAAELFSGKVVNWTNLSVGEDYYFKIINKPTTGTNRLTTMTFVVQEL